ncbi:hypothetical protein [Pedobacter hartonius]|uniref:Uncharacterized protein n=1 Tax=Pedobacter hartonius TaxID=425514 RepID=A0A1H4E2G7_9SPHI|nr:hypothetical protein [Pedobacter hartonius]SEA79223.1 hypothetical protein SAMN05443550_105219 [Pedobacter hartonius]
MITPEDNASFNEEEADEQFSQQDVQSDGIDAVPPSEEDVAASDIDNLSQADKASESSFTLNVDKGIAPGKPDRS